MMITDEPGVAASSRNNSNSNNGGSDGNDSTDNTHITLKPRDYQLALFREALNSNSIVMLETGTGKTLVSVMLIQWFAQRANSQVEQAIGPTTYIGIGEQTVPARRKVRVFLNNTVELVYQQARVISENTNQKVHSFVGAMGIHDWDETAWSGKWASASVLVMTHQVLLNALRAGRARLSDIDLLIFDECHHARGHHPYALIMREFYDHCEPKDRPHIFGMTASPLNAHQTAEDSVMHLQAILNSQICTVDLTTRSHTSGTQQQQQTSLCYEYLLPPDFGHTPLTVSLAEGCSGSKAVGSAMKYLSVVLLLLGPFGVDQMWHHFIRQWHRKVLTRPAASRRPPKRSAMPMPVSVSASVLSEKLTPSIGTMTLNARRGDDEKKGGLDYDNDVDDEDEEDVDGEDMNTTNSDKILADFEHPTATIASNQPASKEGAAENPLQDALYLKRALHIDSKFGGGPFRSVDFGLDISSQHPSLRPDVHPESYTEQQQDVHPTPLLRSISASCEPWDQVRSQLSPQVNRLLSILHQWSDRPTELRGIVFTSRRVTAVLLTYIVSRISEFSYIRTEVLLGGSTKAGSSIINRPVRSGSVRAANQAVLADFASGRLNLIFATQVAEEGVDIQPCNLVIRFDMPQTTTSLIQSRGRARMANSQFIVMVPEIDSEEKSALEGAEIPAGAPAVISCDRPVEKLADENDMDLDDNTEPSIGSTILPQRAVKTQPKTYTDYLQLVMLEECLRDWCLAESQANDRKSTDGMVTSTRSHAEYGRLLGRLGVLLLIDNNADVDAEGKEEPWIEHRDSAGRVYTIMSTKACITYMSAGPIIFQYVQSLPQDDFCKLVPIIDYEEKVLEQEQQGGLEGGTVIRKKNPKPLRVSVFRCVITFPANAALRVVVGPFMPKKKLAKQVATYRAAKKLHQLGAIDDNLLPVIVVGPDFSDMDMDIASAQKSGSKAKGSRSSVEEYATAIPPQFVQPARAPANHPGYIAEAAKAFENDVAEYTPIPWHLHLFWLQHPSSPTPMRLVLATVQVLPPDTAVPLYVSQYTKENKSIDKTQTFIRPLYLGQQTLSAADVDMLASFSSKLMMRAINAALVWNTAEIGALIAPPLPDGLGIDFVVAENCFKDRSPIFNRTNGDFAQCENLVVLDGLDYGRAKIVTKVCHDADLHTNLAVYHARGGKMGPEYALARPTEIPAFASSESEKRKKSKVSARFSVRTMAEWSKIKTSTHLLPRGKIGHGVPLFRVKPVPLTYNYLFAVDMSNVPPKQEEADEGVVNSTGASESSNLPYPDVIYTSPFFCSLDNISLHDINNSSLLPAFFMRLEQVMLANAVKHQLGLTAKVETVRRAITAPNATMDVNYERLETLGDSVLKYISTIMLFVSYPNDHEGLLTSRRGRIVCNANLFLLARRLGLAEYIVAQPFSKRDIRFPGAGWARLLSLPRKWIVASDSDTQGAVKYPPSSHSSSSVSLSDDSSSSSLSSKSTGTIVAAAKVSDSTSQQSRHSQIRRFCIKQQLSEKTVADIVESLLGATILDGGFEGALAAARSFGIVGQSWTSWSRFGTAWKHKEVTRKCGVANLNSLCADLIACTERTPETEELLQEAELDQEDVIFGLASMSISAPGITEWESKLQFAHVQASNLKGQWVKDIERSLGYTFNDRALLLEALTHCSVTDSLSNSYQRLEFLGDAVLDYHVTKRYYDYQPELRPHRITLVKHIVVSNDLFALILVCHGLHKHIRHNSVILAESLRDYEMRLDHARSVWAKSRQLPDSEEHGGVSDVVANISDSENSSGSSSLWEDSMAKATAPRWSEDAAVRPAKFKRVGASSTKNSPNDIYKNLPPECWNIVQAPKVLGDVLESLVGAIYIDSGMDNEVGKTAYERLLCPFLDRFVDSGKLSLHPVIQCLLICQGWGCDQVTWKGRANGDLLEFVNKYICEVKSHGQTLVVGMGESPRHAKFNAANAFLAKIGATAPNALYGDLSAIKSQFSGDTTLEKLLKPVCTCAGIRRAVAEAAAAAANV
ncbi:Dicer-like protein 1 [Kickxella alabastrina]|uniref:Dicer-like protein 1 n=1 Tax=Kickxella alabastrina TaxID=61397 RepID=A0ACC1IW29_9FUNG|nr:Dicer-like protein 1 [Kickxella alabastrina]